MTRHEHKQVLIAGGGIGGLAAAVACAREGLPVQLLERSEQFSEVGAGLQMGPNVTRILRAWGLADAFAQLAAFPKLLQARDAQTGQVLGALRLGERAQALYGAPYATIHRADLHGLLYSAAQSLGADLHLDQNVLDWRESADALQLRTDRAQQFEASALIGADGLWSGVRQQLLGDDAPEFTGHLAYRAVVAQADLPVNLRSDQVTVWMGPRLHVVHYPVRRGEWLNVIAVVHGDQPPKPQDWDYTANANTLMAALGKVGADL